VIARLSVRDTADFGIAGQLGGGHDKADTMIGTPYFLAPEIIVNESGYDEKVDVWATGISCIQLAEMSPPHSDVNPMRALLLITTSSPPTLKSPSKWSAAFNAFLAATLIKEPSLRPSASALLRHDFVTHRQQPDAMKAYVESQLGHPPVRMRSRQRLDLTPAAAAAAIGGGSGSGSGKRAARAGLIRSATGDDDAPASASATPPLQPRSQLSRSSVASAAAPAPPSSTSSLSTAAAAAGDDDNDDDQANGPTVVSVAALSDDDEAAEQAPPPLLPPPPTAEQVATRAAKASADSEYRRVCMVQ
jgi:serine/threonine protein kinase